MDTIFRSLLEDNFSDLPGLTVDASIPVAEHLVNEIIEAALRGNKTIKQCRVSIGGRNKITVHLKTSLWPWPLHLKLKFEDSVELTSRPKVKATLENNVLLGKLGSLLKALPEGITMQGNQVIVDIESFLETPEQRKMLDLLQSLEMRTESGKVIFDIKLKVEGNE